MNTNLYIFLFAVVLCFSCKNEDDKTTDESKFFPVLSFLQGQVKKIDTSLYRIVKVETIDTTTSTSYIRREDFRKYAEPFLEIPDITANKWQEDYKETKMFDEAMNKIILTYTTAEPKNEVRREDVVLDPTNAEGNSEVTTIIINTVRDFKDSSIEKNMVWYVDKRFTIVTKVQKAGHPEKVKQVEVIWNDFADDQP
jgi:hypothetical protein